MKSFEEALPVVYVQKTEDGSPDPVEVQNFLGLVREVTTHEPARTYIGELIEITDQGREEKVRPNGEIEVDDDYLRSLAFSAFVAGIRVGQEMEKQELV